MKENLPMDRVILGILMEGPAHGYDVWALFKERFGGIWSSAPSQVYLVLSRMEREGLVESFPGRSGKRPPKRVFRITERGREMFYKWLEEPVSSMRRLRVEFLVRLYFLMKFRPEILGPLLEKERSICRGKLEELKRKAEDEASLYRRMVYMFKALHIESNLSWIDKVRESLEGGR